MKKKIGLGRTFLVGIKAFIVLLLISPIMAIPYIIWLVLMGTMPMIGLVFFLILIVLYFLALGWLLVKFGGWIFKGVFR